MPNLLIRIKWEYGTEFISFDLNDPPQKGQAVKTTEYWPEERETVEYSAECEFYGANSNEHTFRLRYTLDANPSLRGKNENWGLSDISVNTVDLKATAKWTDSRTDSGLNGPGICTVLDDALLDELQYETVERISRTRQYQLRQDLLKCDGACAISGERTHEVLDAAHIIDASDSGSHTLVNSFLLRSDLHRLFDAGLLTVSPNGKVALENTASPTYQDELIGKKIPSLILARIAAALEQRAVRRVS